MARGEITHIEFPADDLERARQFYEAVARWEIQPMEGFPDYLLFRTGDASGGAIGLRGQSVGTVTRPYITVDVLEDALRIAEEHGGRQVTGPTDIPGMGRYAAVTDPEGNEIGLWQTVQG